MNPSDSSNPTSPTPSVPPVSTPPGAAAAPVEQAKADLTKRLGIAETAVKVLGAEEVTWSDGSLGCPEPGMHYTQALVNGMRITLEADGKRYEYHSGGARPPFLCENPQAR
ncbi:hypothetical protein HPO96_08145 [Kribbella sandramycini]|uniref:Uncharacterized protein n=1 Tax=Kribbella sandramycini TaxID=60450 RepID=A0A7Y4KYC4_9ACTN|nr:hypothetical protein [Kribbella sandramycini]MBB6569964.1 hypothetical protein [Kribbella sandramycini]NOL40212.1 hypothetical protein [Kribbella sandramycini]